MDQEIKQNDGKYGIYIPSLNTFMYFGNTKE